MSKNPFMKITAALFALAVLFPCTAYAAEFPTKEAGVYVYDTAEVISAETEADINARADALFAMSGAQIITVCVKTTDGTAIGEYATSLFNEWQIGSPQRDNGLLCVMAVEDREYWLLQGNGIKNEITNGQLQVINNDYLEGYFAEEKYDEGAKAVFDQLLLKFEALYSIDIDKWDGKYIDFTYSDTTGEQTTAPAETPAYNMMGFLTTFLWIAAAVVLVIVVIVVVSVLRRPRFVDGGYFHRRKYKGERGPYVGIPPQMPLNSRGQSRRAPNGQLPGGHRPNGQTTGGQYPTGSNGQRPQGQRPAQRPSGQYPNGQHPKAQYPNGHPAQRQGNPNAQRPANQRPQSMNGQNQRIAQNDPRAAQARNGARRPTRQADSPKTVYPENPPYINGANIRRTGDDQRNGGSQ